MGKVIKRGGRKQAFSSAKIKRSVYKAARETKLSASKIKELVKDVAEPVIKLYKNKRTVKSVVLRRSILKRLDRRAKSVSAAWRRFDRKRH